MAEWNIAPAAKDKSPAREPQSAAATAATAGATSFSFSPATGASLRCACSNIRNNPCPELFPQPLAPSHSLREAMDDNDDTYGPLSSFNFSFASATDNWRTNNTTGTAAPTASIASEPTLALAPAPQTEGRPYESWQPIQ